MTYALLEGAEDVRRYLAGTALAPRLGDAHALEVREVTAGNMNRVFIASGSHGSVAVKQAPPFVQVAGPDWPIDPSRIAAEARAYDRLAELTPDIVPAVLHFDLERFVLVMEDLSDLAVLRDALVGQLAAAAAGAAPRALDLSAVAAAMGRFVGALTRETSVRVLGPEAHTALVRESANPDLCGLTLDVVLDEPFRRHEHNRWRPVLSTRVEALYRDAAVRSAVELLRERFRSATESLVHGDLHSGSVMVGVRGGDTVTKVFDPEFSFVGPVGLDLGLIWANLAIAGAAARAVGASDLAAERESGIATSWAAFLAERPELTAHELAGIRADAWRFAAAEAFRRVAGYSHAADIESLPDESADAAAVAIFDRARRWLLDARDDVVPAPTIPNP